MRNIAILILLLLNFSCQSAQNKVDTKNKEVVKLDSIQTDSISSKNEIAKECIQKDTVTAMGTSIKYSYENEGFKITWSDSLYERSLDSLYECFFNTNTEATWDFVPKYIHETKNTVALQNILYTSSGGNPAPLEHYVIVLPKNKKGSVLEIELFLIVQNDYLVYGDEDMNTIHILNLETKEEQKLNLKYEPFFARSPNGFISDFSIENNTFYIKYEGVKNKKDQETTDIKESFKIKI